MRRRAIKGATGTGPARRRAGPAPSFVGGRRALALLVVHRDRRRRRGRWGWGRPLVVCHHGCLGFSDSLSRTTSTGGGGGGAGGGGAASLSVIAASWGIVGVSQVRRLHRWRRRSGRRGRRVVGAVHRVPLCLPSVVELDPPLLVGPPPGGRCREAWERITVTAGGGGGGGGGDACGLSLMLSPPGAVGTRCRAGSGRSRAGAVGAVEAAVPRPSGQRGQTWVGLLSSAALHGLRLSTGGI